MELNTAYEKSLIEGYFIDTVFYLYSCKSPSTGEVHKPRPVYASSKMLISASPYFATLLSGRFQEGRFGKLDEGFPEGEATSVDDYEYDSDSDLDWEELEDESGSPDMRDSVASETLPAATELSSSGSESIESYTDADDYLATASAEDYAGPELVTDVWCKLIDIQTKPSSNIDVHVIDPEPPCRDWVRNGRIVIIRGFAYTTWLSMVRYLGTKQTSFAPLVRLGQQDGARSLFDSSPKSMYRLAHLLELEEAKRLALDNLRTQLQPTIIFPEIFSFVGNTYSDVSQVLEDYIISYRQESGVREAAPEWIAKVASGMYAGQSSVFSRAFVKLLVVSESPTSHSIRGGWFGGDEWDE